MNIALATQETLGLMKESLAKNVTIQTGLTAYDLQAPAKNLYPTITPLRNSASRSATEPGRCRPLARNHDSHRLRLRRDGVGAGGPTFGEHELFGRPQYRALCDARRG